MPRRPPPPSPPPKQELYDRDAVLYADLLPLHAANLRELRSNWKWAAFSQFWYTFAPLLALPDISLTDVEDDLARPSSLYLPRVMQRLLITLTQDRKINPDNWQTALRKQYSKRDPLANPIGPEPEKPESEDDDENDGGDTHDEAIHPSSDAPEPPPDADTPAAADFPHSDAPTPNALPDLSTPANSTPAPEQLSKSVPRRKGKKKGKAGSRAQSRGVQNGDIQVQFHGESKDWLELPLLEKLDSLHLLVEWQFQNPQRLRQLMKDDDETAQWRIEPIGYDAKTNAYWFIGPDRLWIQRAPPKPPRPAKRKRAPAKPKPTPSRKVVQEDSEEDEPPVRSAKRKRVQRSTRASGAASHPPQATPTSSRSRAAKVQANKKLDAQAKELAEFQRQAAATSASAKTRVTRQKSASPQKRAAVGTRASARLRGPARTEDDDDDDDEWQEIPKEWLKPVSSVSEDEEEQVEEKHESDRDVHDANEADDVGGDDSSELTELSDSSAVSDVEDAKPQREATKPRSTRKTNRKVFKVEDEEAMPDPVEEEAPQLPSDFVEWELICITLYDWEHVADSFANATHYLEKALYKSLTQSIVPAVTAELKELERQRKIEEAMVHRKRSSRIAMKESEKEEARMAAIKRAEEDEKEARAKRAEARAKKEQAEREKRENAREQRRLDREEREERARRKEERDRARNLEAERQGGSATPSSVSTPAPDRHRASSSVQLSRVASRSSTSTPDWVLDCEICHKHGVNMDDGLPMVSCGSCNRWQHITCHDNADATAGRPRRNWKLGQFYCQRCRHIIQSRQMAHSGSRPYVPPQHQHQHYQTLPYAQKSPEPSGYSNLQHSAYRQSTSDLRYSHSSYAGGGSSSRDLYAGGQHATSSVPSYTQMSQHSSQASNGYAPYPPDQRSIYSSSSSVRNPIVNGYPPATDSYPRHHPPVPVPQRSTMYEAPAMSSLHQNHSSYPPSHSSTQYREPYPQPQSRWSNGGDQYYTSSNGIPNRGMADLSYHSQESQHGGSSAWHRSTPSHVERDASLQQAVVSPTGYTPTYNYPGS